MLSNHIEYYPIKPSNILYDKAYMLYEFPVLENPGAVLTHVRTAPDLIARVGSSAIAKRS